MFDYGLWLFVLIISTYICWRYYRLWQEKNRLHHKLNRLQSLIDQEQSTIASDQLQAKLLLTRTEIQKFTGSDESLSQIITQIVDTLFATLDCDCLYVIYVDIVHRCIVSQQIRTAAKSFHYFRELSFENQGIQAIVQESNYLFNDRYFDIYQNTFQKLWQLPLH